MASDFQSVFVRLRAILQACAGTLAVKEDTPSCYCLEGAVGPATLKAWGGKIRTPRIPVAWVEVGKSAISYHLMPIAGNEKLISNMSKELRARMQGKTCFNFKMLDEALIPELEQLTLSAITGFKKAGFISDSEV
jgi:hypothetical protein